MYWRLIIIYLIVFVIIYNLGYIEYKDINSDNFINVEIKGEVEKDIVLNVEKGTCLNDILDDIHLLDSSSLEKISLLEPLYNNQIIVIDKKSYSLISLNNASIKQLCTLPGIGESIANNILEYRNNYGCFNSVEELMNVKGIGIAKFNKIKEFICL